MVIFFAIILGIIPSLTWLIFFLKEDIHPEPKKLIAKIFFAGSSITLAAVFFQFIFLKVFRQYEIAEYGLIPFFVFALTEECFKFFAAYFVVRKSKYFNEPIDAMIYMITSALGFAAVENILIILNNTNHGKAIGEVMGILVLRFVGATLLHALSSGALGYYWAKSLAFSTTNAGANKIVKIPVFAKGMALAVVLHAVFNYFILIFNKIFIIPILFLTIVALFIFFDFEKLKIKSQSIYCK